MAKMIFSKEETRNLLMMLQSEDADNHLIAFESLKNVDFEKYIGELLVLYKFGGHTMDNWKANCISSVCNLLSCCCSLSLFCSRSCRRFMF